MRPGRKLLVLAGFAVLTAVAVGRPVRPSTRKHRPAWRIQRAHARSFLRSHIADELTTTGASGGVYAAHLLEPVSPELALIDPDLAARARALGDAPVRRVHDDVGELVSREWRVVSTPTEDVVEGAGPELEEAPLAEIFPYPAPAGAVESRQPIAVGLTARRFVWPG